MAAHPKNAREANRDHHAERMLNWGQAMSTPVLITFSLGALISLGENAIMRIAADIAAHHFEPILIKYIAILLIAIVGVVAMDLVMINDSIEIRDRLANDKKPEMRLWVEVYGFAFLEACTFAFVAWQLDNPANPFAGGVFNFAAFVSWGFIFLRAVGFPAAGIRLATLAKKPTSLKQIASNQAIATNDALEDKLSAEGKSLDIAQLLTLSVLWEQIQQADTPAQRITYMQQAIKFYTSGELPATIDFEKNDAGSPNKYAASPGGARSGGDGSLLKQAHDMNNTGAPLFTNGGGDQSHNGALVGSPINFAQSPSDDTANVGEHALTYQAGAQSGFGGLNPTNGDQGQSGGDTLPGPESLAKSYVLPPTLYMDSALTQQDLKTVFDISDSTFSRRWQQSPVPGVAPTRKQNGNGYIWQVWQILYLYEQGFFDGLNTAVFDQWAATELAA